jgi:hypothetical protein
LHITTKCRTWYEKIAHLFHSQQKLVSAPAPEAASSEAASAKEAGPEPVLAASLAESAVNHHGNLRLVNPARPRDVHPWFFRSWGDIIAAPLASRAEAVSLSQNGVHNHLVPVKERMDRVVISPERVAVSVEGGYTKTRIQKSEPAQVAGKQEVFKKTSDLDEASPNAVLKARIPSVGGVVLLLAASCENVPRQRNEEDDTPSVE